MIATMYVGKFGIDAQREDESDIQFRGRVAGVLRDNEKIIEAHEVYNDEYQGESDAVTTGVMGALAQYMQGVDYRVSGRQQIATDFAAGMVVKNPREEMSPEMALMAVLLFGQR